ncbi:MAG: iron-sulfur cluster assembly accessory protein [Leptothrix sp. (in: Bacteria)]|nr:iron-sulfur cluster assembly accessory protein [Leptothrix sp. (in: b-proteobacteria)]
MFSITPSATQELLAAAARSDAAGMGLRVAARQVADGSIEYGMGFDDEREDDEPVAFDGLKVLLGSPSRPLLQDTVLDYVEIEPGRFDFVFVPPDAAPADGDDAPKAARSCGSGGCGNCGG